VSAQLPPWMIMTSALESPHRRDTLPPAATSYQKFVQLHHAHLGKKNETHPATARDLRFPGPAPARIECAQQPTHSAHHPLTASGPPKLTLHS